MNRTMIGLAVKLCVSLGLHRKSSTSALDLLDAELDKRLFWTCYSLDRDITLTMGRPPSLSDHDIDAPVRTTNVPSRINRSLLTQVSFPWISTKIARRYKIFMRPSQNTKRLPPIHLPP